MKIDHQKFNYRRLAMMAGTAVVALSTTISPVHAAPAVSGQGVVEKTAQEGVLINISPKTHPGQLIQKGERITACTGVLVSNNPSTNKTRAVLTAGHCVYPRPGDPGMGHWDVGAPYANENKLHPSFGLKVVHPVDRRDKRNAGPSNVTSVAEPYPDWKTWDGILAGTKTEKLSNLEFLHDIGLICLGEPIATKLPVLDTSTHVYPYNTVDATRGLHTDVILLGRINNVDNRYPPGLGDFQELFRTNPVRTIAVKEQSLPDESPLKIRNEFLVNIPSLGNIMDEGDSGGPVFLAGTHRVVGIAARIYTDFDEADIPEKRADGFSRLDDPLVALWLKYEIDQCNNTGSLDRNFDQAGGPLPVRGPR